MLIVQALSRRTPKDIFFNFDYIFVTFVKSLLNSLLSSLLNIDVTNPFEFLGNDTIIYVSILLLVAGLILTVFDEKRMKTFFFRCFGFLTFA